MTPDAIKDMNANANAMTTSTATVEPDVSPMPRTSTFHLPPGEPDDERLQRVLAEQAAGRNPLLRAADVLLRSLATMPRELAPEEAVALREFLTREIEVFTRICERANLRRDHLQATRFALCTALDEAANLRPWGGGVGGTLGAWSRASLLQHFHQEGNGGEKTFLLIDRLASSNAEHIDVLEVMHHILGLGFEGHYRADPNGRRTLESLRHRLHSLVSSARGPVPRPLSPQWRGVAAGRFRLLRRVPVWLSSMLAMTGLVCLYSYFHWSLSQAATPVHACIAAIATLAHQRPEASPPLRLAGLLADDIAAGRVAVVDGDSASVVTFKGDGMFAVGQSQIRPQSQPLLARVGAELRRLSEAGALRVAVTGHSDNQPIATPQFADNTALSLARARAVETALGLGNALAPGKTAVIRAEAAGAGDSAPVADNATPSGRARNRRVELAVTY